MGRVKKSLVYNYFTYDESEGTSTCKIEDCDRVFKGNHANNLLKHILARHHDIYKKIIPADRIESLKNKARSPKKRKYQEESKNLLLTCCVKLVQEYKLPMTIFDDVNFKNIMTLSGGRVMINSKTVWKFMHEGASPLDISTETRKSSTNAENGNSSSDEMFKIKGEKAQCSCSNNDGDGDDGVLHSEECPLSRKQAYWNYFEVSIDTAACLLCRERLDWENIAELKDHLADHHPGVTFKDDDEEFENGPQIDVSRDDIAEVYLEDADLEPAIPRKRRKPEQQRGTERKEEKTTKQDKNYDMTPQIIRTLDSFGQYVADLMKLLPKAKSIKFQLQIVERLLKEASIG